MGHRTQMGSSSIEKVILPHTSCTRPKTLQLQRSTNHLSTVDFIGANSKEFTNDGTISTSGKARIGNTEQKNGIPASKGETQAV